jgi:hypothetical protein
LNRGAAPISGGERPHVNITVDLATLERRARAPGADVGRVDQPISEAPRGVSRAMRPSAAVDCAVEVNAGSALCPRPPPIVGGGL